MAVERRMCSHPARVFLTRANDRVVLSQNRMTLLLKQLEQLVYVFLPSTEVHGIDAKPSFAFELGG